MKEKMKNHSGRCGEHIVCAELLRRGIVATTFSGNMPDFDILTPSHKVQVKTTTEKGKKDETWPIGNADKWLKFDEELLKREIQRILGKQERDDKDYIFVFVLLGGKYGKDRFFILKQPEVQDIIYNRYIGKCKEEYEGYKVRRRKSTYANVHLFQLEPYEDKWGKFNL